MKYEKYLHCTISTLLGTKTAWARGGRRDVHVPIDRTVFSDGLPNQLIERDEERISPEGKANDREDERGEDRRGDEVMVGVEGGSDAKAVIEANWALFCGHGQMESVVRCGRARVLWYVHLAGSSGRQTGREGARGGARSVARNRGRV